MADFTDQNIQDTYQRVVQIDNGQLQDGTGSVILSSTELSSIQAIGSPAITSTEWAELKNIGSAEISSTEWGYVASMQDVSTNSTPTFNTLSLKGQGASAAPILSFTGPTGSISNPQIGVSRGGAMFFHSVEDSSDTAITFINQNGQLAATIDNNGTYQSLVGDSIAELSNLVTLSSAQTITGVKTISTNKKLQFRDSGIYLNSNTDGTLQIVSDNKVNIFGNIVKIYAPLTASGNISASGTLIANEANIIGNITSSGNISASGNLIGSQIQANNGIELYTGNLNAPDNSRIRLGSGTDLQIYHDGSHSYIKDSGTGNLRVDATNFFVRNADGTKIAIDAIDGAEVKLRYDGAKKLATTPDGIEVIGEISASGNIKANYIETAKIPLIQYISDDTTSTAQGRVLAAGSHDNASDSFALEWSTPLFEDTDFFETGSVSPTTTGAINNFAVKQDGRYEINCNVAFKGTSGARPGINLGIFTSSNASSIGDFRPAGPSAHAYVRVAAPAMGSTAAIPGFVIQLSSGSAINIKVDLKDDFGGTGNTFWSGSLSHFSMKKIG